MTVKREYIRIVKRSDKEIDIYYSDSLGANKVWSLIGSVMGHGEIDVQMSIHKPQKFDCDCEGNPFCETCMGVGKIYEPPEVENESLEFEIP